jgi:hypothetical protein
MHWRPENILRRELELLNFAASRWSIPCDVDNGSIRLPPPFSEQVAIEINQTVCFGESMEEEMAEDELENGDAPMDETV